MLTARSEEQLTQQWKTQFRKPSQTK